MLLYIFCFGCLMGFIIHFYIIFGTNLLTGGPAQIAVFSLFQCFEGKEYQTESKRNETFGNVIFSPNVIQETWSWSQGSFEVATRQRRAQGVGRAPTLVVALGLFWPTSGTPWASSGPKIRSVKFQVNWTPFGFPFLRYSKTRKKQKLALGSRLIG